MTEREKFEAWCRKEALLFGLTYYDDDEYLDAYTQYAWIGWQAAIESQKTQLSSNPLQLHEQEPVAWMNTYRTFQEWEGSDKEDHVGYMTMYFSTEKPVNNKKDQTIVPLYSVPKESEKINQMLCSGNAVADQKIQKLRDQGFENYSIAAVLGKDAEICVVGKLGDVRWVAASPQGEIT